MAEGIKIAIQGVDARTAPDYQLLFNSDWPTLKVVKNAELVASIAANSPSGLVPLYNHGLGYPPAFLPYSLSSGAQLPAANIGCDAQSIYFLNPGNTAPALVDIGILIFALDLTTNYTAPNIQTGGVSNAHSPRNFGVKIAKSGFDANSNTDLRDFAVHSASRGPLVHAVSTGGILVPTGQQLGGQNINGFSYTHNLPYSPIFFAYLNSFGTKSVWTLVNGFTGTTAVGNTITVTDLGTASLGSIVTLKDPFNIDDNIINVNL